MGRTAAGDQVWHAARQDGAVPLLLQGRQLDAHDLVLLGRQLAQHVPLQAPQQVGRQQAVQPGHLRHAHAQP